MRLSKDEIIALTSMNSGVPISKITTSQSFRALGMDSVSIVALMAQIEKKSGVIIPDDEIYALTNIDRVLEFITQARMIE